MFKKFIFALMLIIVPLISLSTTETSAYTGYSAKSEQGHYIDVRKIENASYSDIQGVFYVYTTKDETGGSWVIDFKPLKGETLSEFKNRVIGSYLIVKYIGNLEADEEIEILGQYIWKEGR